MNLGNEINEIFRQGLVVEKRHLDESLERLKTYCGSLDTTVDHDSWSLVRRQMTAMKEYSHALGLRIEIFAKQDLEKP